MLGVQSLSPWTTRKVPLRLLLILDFLKMSRVFPEYRAGKAVHLEECRARDLTADPWEHHRAQVTSVLNKQPGGLGCSRGLSCLSSPDPPELEDSSLIHGEGGFLRVSGLSPPPEV